MAGVSVKQAYPISNGKKMFIGTGGAITGAALGLYLHKLAKTQAEQLEVLDLFKKYILENNFRGIDSYTDSGDVDTQFVDLATKLEQLELWNFSQHANLENIAAIAKLDGKIVEHNKKWWLYTILELLCFGGTIVGGSVALQGLYKALKASPETHVVQAIGGVEVKVKKSNNNQENTNQNQNTQKNNDHKNEMNFNGKKSDSSSTSTSITKTKKRKKNRKKRNNNHLSYEPEQKKLNDSLDKQQSSNKTTNKKRRTKNSSKTLPKKEINVETTKLFENKNRRQIHKEQNHNFLKENKNKNKFRKTQLPGVARDYDKNNKKKEHWIKSEQEKQKALWQGTKNDRKATTAKNHKWKLNKKKLKNINRH